MSFFVKITHVGNRSKLDNLFKNKKITHNLGDDYKNKPLVPNKKLDNNLKMNKIETTKCVLQHKVCDICIATGDIFEQFHLIIFLTFNLFVSIRIN